MSITRVAVIFDDQARPETTGVYCLRAYLRSSKPSTSAPRISTKSRATPSISSSTSTTACATIYRRICVPRRGGPSTPTSTSSGASERPGALTSCSPPSAMAQISCARPASPRHPGFRSPAIPRSTASMRSTSTTTSLSSATSSPVLREELLAILRWKYPRSFIGQRDFDDMARTYSEVHTVFNRSIKNDVNMRVFEGARVRLISRHQRPQRKRPGRVVPGRRTSGDLPRARRTARQAGFLPRAREARAKTSPPPAAPRHFAITRTTSACERCSSRPRPRSRPQSSNPVCIDFHPVAHLVARSHLLRPRAARDRGPHSGVCSQSARRWLRSGPARRGDQEPAAGERYRHRAES